MRFNIVSRMMPSVAKNNKFYYYIVRMLAILSVVEFCVIIFSFHGRTVLYHVQQRDNQNTDQFTPAKKPTTPIKQKDTLYFKAATRNLPFKMEYTNATISFALGRYPTSLKGWLPKNDSYQWFQPMDNKDAWVYSAFWDPAKAKDGQSMVRAFGIARTPLPWRIYCHYHQMKNNKLQFVSRPGFMKGFLEDHRCRVVPFQMECKVPIGLFPKTVSFTFKPKTKMSNGLPIQYPSPRRRKFTVCYSAFHSNFNDTSRLIQSINFNRILGAEHFVVYNFSISKDTDTILRHYMAKGLVSVQQWPLPTLESWYLGQIAILNDCLYRNRNVSEFVVFCDTDELIVPKRHDTWWEMIKAIEKNSSLEVFETTKKSSLPKQQISTNSTRLKSENDQLSKESLPLRKDNSQKHYNSSSVAQPISHLPIGTFIFQTAFFNCVVRSKIWKEIKSNFSISKDDESFFRHFRVYPMYQYIRMDNVFTHKRRSKIIVRPELVHSVGIHYPYRHVRGTRESLVRGDVALVQHYRSFDRKGSNTIDVSAFRFKKHFLRGLRDEFSKFRHLVH